MNFHGQYVLYDMYCNPTVVLKIDSVYKQSKNYNPLAYAEECKYIDSETLQYIMLANSDDNGYCEM